jgi:selenocysteine lyase/cysteine desulfurase
MPTRRTFLAGLGAASLASVVEARADRAPARPDDEQYWRAVRAEFTLHPSIVNFNNGGVHPSPRVVQEAMRRDLEHANTSTAYTLWVELEPRIEEVRKRLAASFGCDPEEMAITRNASEALEIAIFGLDLRAGDEVLTTNQDYPRMLTTWRQRERREGVVLKTISLPLADGSDDEIVARFASAITPRTRVVMLCHVVNITGRVMPVREICRLGRERGVEVVVDGAHGFNHFPFTRDDLDCDYYGTSLHKWTMAPHGTGFLYVRRSKIERLWPLMAAEAKQSGDIRKFEEIGTHPAANHNAIATALDFQERIGLEAKAARLRYLKERWASRLTRLRGARLLAPLDRSVGVATLSIEGADVGKLAKTLLERHTIHVVPIVHEEFSGIRVTPSVYATVGEVDRFCDAVEREV